MKNLLIVITLLLSILSNGFTQITRRSPPAVRTDTVPKKINTNPINTTKTVSNIPKPFGNISDDNLFIRSKLFFFEKMIAPECKSNCETLVYSFQKQFDYILGGAFPSSHDWKYQLLWKKYPAETVNAKWQISYEPFTDNTNASAIISEGLFAVTNKDSVVFSINYAEPKVVPITGIIKKIPPIGTTTTQSDIKTLPRLKRNNNIKTSSTSASIFLDVTKDLMVRKYYIRIIPINSRGQALKEFSNTLSVIENTKIVKKPSLTTSTNLSNDYTITNIKYVPVHYPEQAFVLCGIVHNPSNVGFFKHGQVICPQPDKEKAWYEKAFNGVTGFVEELINGAAKYYNETKNYLKEKWKEFNCDNNSYLGAISPTSKVGAMLPEEVCGYLSNAAFEYGMAVVGLPPTLPTTDELTKLAQGQIVDLAIDKIEEETGVPVPEAAREKMKKELNEKLNNSSVSASGGGLNIKPHPAGQFQTAYLELEVTRTSKNSRDRQSVALSYSDIASTNSIAVNSKTNVKTSITLSSNLFESTGTKVPYIENVGDKTKVYIFLKPAINYYHYDKNTDELKSISNSPPFGVFYTPHNNESYERGAAQTEFQHLSKPGSTLKINLGLKLAEGINTLIQN